MLGEVENAGAAAGFIASNPLVSIVGLLALGAISIVAGAVIKDNLEDDIEERAQQYYEEMVANAQKR